MNRPFNELTVVLALLVLTFSAIGVTPAHASGIRYAAPVAFGTGDCSSWTNACTLQTALTGAVGGDEIWVMQGTHKPTTGTTRTVTFQLKNGVALYGGFAGTEVARGERNPALNVTILSGEIGAAGTGDNSYHVVTGGGTDSTAVLDAFTITAGNANLSYSHDYGGGMYNNGSSPTLTDVTFSGNSAIYGGGMSNTGSSPTLTDVTFSGNSVASGGAGGGMFNNSSNPTLTNVTFSGNSTFNGGGGMYNNSSNPTLTNVTFSANTAWGGGAMSNTGSSPTLTNVTFSGNSTTNGGAMYNSQGSTPVIYDSIFWNDGSEITNDSSAPTITDSIVAGGCPSGATCVNLITSDPLLVALADNGGFTQTMALGAGSPAIDAGGVNSACPPPTTDQRGLTRPQGARCDIGSYESVRYATYLPLVLR